MQPTRRTSRQKGHSLIEFALGWGVLWLLFSGVFYFGYSFYTYNKLMLAASDAAMFASKLTYDVANPNAFKTSIKNMVLYGTPSPTGTERLVVPRITVNNVNVEINPVGGMPTDITVTIQNYTVDGIFKTFVLVNKPRCTSIYMGQIVDTAT